MIWINNSGSDDQKVGELLESKSRYNKPTLAKLGTLALKTFCKPIANRLKKEAGLHPKFRHFIINIAQANHRFTTKMQRRIYGHSVDAVIRPLDAEKAVQAAADLIGELFVFSVAGAAVIFEVQRSSRSEARKEEQRRQEIEDAPSLDKGIAGTMKIRKYQVLDASRNLEILVEIFRSRVQGLADTAMKQRDEELAKEIQVLKQKLDEVEQLARGRGLGGLFHFRHGHASEDGNAKPT
ncbi:unnamed protein product [Dovyalis caffra]|uniref:Optic atrophy 3 protein n=1 Tax=Dovyalis caffra TaxID=77055 RepID=A0AAV1QQ99_9ROSI|nr:unnamed protein product [Dovyalis caffra]